METIDMESMSIVLEVRRLKIGRKKVFDAKDDIMSNIDNIAIVGLHVYPTYRDLTIGIPDNEMNNGFITTAEEKAANLFGSPVHTIPPKTTDQSVARTDGTAYQSPRLPNYTVLVRLKSFEIEGNFDGRILTVVFFVNDIYAAPIDQIVGTAIQNLNWKEYAQLWQF